jgi:two-component system, OmpR family, KDP operon response regulator KdpE
MSSVLLVDDDRQLLRTLRITLTARGYQVLLAPDGATGLSMAGQHQPDLVIVDLGLPDMDGIDVVTGIRGWSSVPIVVLSARHAEPAKVNALDAGADDYVTKPFGVDELLARIRAALRRGAPGGDAVVVRTPTLSIDLAGKRVERDGTAVRLTPTEWHLLEVLVRNAGKLVTHQQLLSEVWGPGYQAETQYLRVYLAQLRAKLETDPAHPRHLCTEPGMGYRFEA